MIAEHEIESIRESAEVRLLKMTSVRREFLHFSNVIAGLRRSLSFAWNGQAADFHFSASDQDISPTWTVGVNLGGHEFVVYLHRLPEIGWMSPELAGVDLSQLPEELACAVLQSCLGDVHTSLARHGIDLKVQSFSPFSHARASSEILGWSVNRGQDVNWLRGLLSTSDEGWRYLAALVKKSSIRSTGAADVPFPVQIVAGSIKLPAALLKNLELHDVILADVQGYIRLRECSLFMQKKFIGSAVANRQTVTLNQFNLNAKPDMAESAAEPVALDELEVTLTFVVGQTTLSLGELKTLAPGASFELPAPVSEAVTIQANGKAIGTGELLEVGGRVGVRITKLTAA